MITKGEIVFSDDMKNDVHHRIMRTIEGRSQDLLKGAYVLRYNIETNESEIKVELEVQKIIDKDIIASGSVVAFLVDNFGTYEWWMRTELNREDAGNSVINSNVNIEDAVIDEVARLMHMMGALLPN